MRMYCWPKILTTTVYYLNWNTIRLLTQSNGLLLNLMLGNTVRRKLSYITSTYRYSCQRVILFNTPTPTWDWWSPLVLLPVDSFCHCTSDVIPLTVCRYRPCATSWPADIETAIEESRFFVCIYVANITLIALKN